MLDRVGEGRLANTYAIGQRLWRLGLSSSSLSVAAICGSSAAIAISASTALRRVGLSDFSRSASSVAILSSPRSMRLWLAGWLNERLDLKKLRTVGKVAVCLFRDEDNIFKAHAAHAEIIKSRFDGDHVPRS